MRRTPIGLALSAQRLVETLAMPEPVAGEGKMQARPACPARWLGLVAHGAVLAEPTPERLGVVVHPPGCVVRVNNALHPCDRAGGDFGVEPDALGEDFLGVLVDHDVKAAVDAQTGHSGVQLVPVQRLGLGHSVLLHRAPVGGLR